MQVYEIVHKVQESHRGLLTRLSERARKSKSVFAAHAAEPSTMNADSYGKPSPADHFVDQCEEYEACSPGAGLMLADLIHAEVRSRITHTDMLFCQQEMRRDVLKEATEAVLALDECDFEDANLSQMKNILLEVQELSNKASQAVGHIIATIRQKELQRASERTVKRFRSAA